MDSVAPRYPSEDINYTFKNISFCWLHWFCFLARTSVLKFGACFTVWFLWNVWWVLVTCSSLCILRFFSDLHMNADSVFQSQMSLLEPGGAGDWQELVQVSFCLPRGVQGTSMDGEVGGVYMPGCSKSNPQPLRASPWPQSAGSKLRASRAAPRSVESSAALLGFKS